MGQLVQTKGGAVAVKVDEAPSQYLTFALGGEMFAVGILNVKEPARQIRRQRAAVENSSPDCKTEACRAPMRRVELKYVD